MTWLTVIIAVMTLTVTSKSTVATTGDVPSSAAVAYNCSYQKGTVRQGDDAVLTISQLGGVTIRKVEVYIRSNKSGGAGTWSVVVDEQTVATKSGSFEQWFGAYDNTNYHALSLLPKTYQDVQDLTIRLHGTANTLYIDRYVITYTPAPTHTVTLMRGNAVYQTITETTGGAGVLLPAMDDYNDWRFIGWSETEFGQTTTRPELIAPNTVCYPLTDVTLWAAYEYVPSEDSVYVSELTDGEYLYMNTASRKALTGVPEEGRMECELFNRMSYDQVYSFTFTPSKDTVYLVHTATGTPIGYNSQQQLVATPSPWLVYHKENETILYAFMAGRNYILWLDVTDGEGRDPHAGLYPAKPANSTLKLAYPANEDELVYTCHPENGFGVERIWEKRNYEYIIPFGCYDLHIRNGEKELRLR